MTVPPSSVDSVRTVGPHGLHPRQERLACGMQRQTISPFCVVPGSEAGISAAEYGPARRVDIIALIFLTRSILSGGSPFRKAGRHRPSAPPLPSSRLLEGGVSPTVSPNAEGPSHDPLGPWPSPITRGCSSAMWRSGMPSTNADRNDRSVKREMGPHYWNIELDGKKSPRRRSRPAHLQKLSVDSGPTWRHRHPGRDQRSRPTSTTPSARPPEAGRPSPALEVLRIINEPPRPPCPTGSPRNARRSWSSTSAAARRRVGRSTSARASSSQVDGVQHPPRR